MRTLPLLLIGMFGGATALYGFTQTAPAIDIPCSARIFYLKKEIVPSTRQHFLGKVVTRQRYMDFTGHGRYADGSFTCEVDYTKGVES